MFRSLGTFCITHPWKVCAAWIALAVGLTLVAPNWRNQSQDDDIRFLPDSYPVVRGFKLLEQAFPQDVFACRVLFAIERPDGELGAEDFQLVDRLAAELAALSKENPRLQITGVVSYSEPMIGSRLISADRQCTLIQMSLATPYLAAQTQATVDQAEARIRPLVANSGLELHVTGPGGVGRDLVKASAQSLDNTTLATVILVVLILLAVYRSPLLALIPLVTIGLATWVALQVLALA